MKKNKTMLVFLLGVCALIGAAQGQSRDGEAKYHVSYEWSAGALPPRSHYQYRIEIEPSGKGSIVMVPEYPTIYDTDIPRWKETFSIDASQLQKLSGFIEANKMLSPGWEGTSKKDDPVAVPPGASTCRIEIRTEAQSSRVPCNDWEVPSPFRRRRDEFADMMKKLVPAKSWARLNDAQRQYSTHG